VIKKTWSSFRVSLVVSTPKVTSFSQRKESEKWGLNLPPEVFLREGV
jgi:hypothetical protein